MTPVKWLDKQAKIKHVTLNEADQLVPVANHFAEIARRYEAMEKVIQDSLNDARADWDSVQTHPASRHANAVRFLEEALAAARAPIGETT